MKTKKKESFVMAKLDKKTMLAANPNSFIIKERVKAKDGSTLWRNKYHYSELGDAVRGYVRHLLRRPSTAKKLDGDIETLLKFIEKLEKTVKKVGDKLNMDFAERMQDPVECHRFFAGDDT